jgi:pimeloyl-ACP methyl ester carboxylesterase
VAKPSKISAAPVATVRMRRAYFDCRFGQLHVRTAFPTTGGFDEEVTLLCLHTEQASSRSFQDFLPLIAEDRSVYAPDLPGCGESDAAPDFTTTSAAEAAADLASELRLRQIDVLGFRFGAGAALQLASLKPGLVRRLVLIGAPPVESLPLIRQDALVMRVKLGHSDDSQWARNAIEKPKFFDLQEYDADLFETRAKILAQQVGDYLKSK